MLRSKFNVKCFYFLRLPAGDDFFAEAAVSRMSTGASRLHSLVGALSSAVVGYYIIEQPQPSTMSPYFTKVTQHRAFPSRHAQTQRSSLRRLKARRIGHIYHSPCSSKQTYLLRSLRSCRAPLDAELPT